MSSEDTNILEEINDNNELSLPTAIRVKNISEINFELADSSSPGTSNSVNNKRKMSDSPQPTETGNINNNCKRSKSEKNPTTLTEEIDNSSKVNATSENDEKLDSINSGQPPNCSLNDSNNNKHMQNNEHAKHESSTISDNQPNAATASENDNKDSKLKIKSEVKIDDEDESNTVSDAQPNVVTTSVKTEATSTTRDSCRYGVRCYRQNPMHRSEEAHPGDSDYRRPDFPSPPIGTPPCPFGDKCYRRHPSHFQQYSHPPATDFNKNWKIRQMVLRKRKQTNYVQNDGDDDDYDLSDPFIDDNSEDEYKVEDDDEDSDSDY